MSRPGQPRTALGSAALVLAALLGFLAQGARAQTEADSGLDFVPSEEPGPGSIYLRADPNADPGGVVRVEVWANEVVDLYGLGFTLQFPRELLKFPKSRATASIEGPFLSEGGLQETIFLVRQIEDEISVGVSRKGQTGGVSGSGLLLSLEFRGREQAGKKSLRLRNRSAHDSTGEEIADTRWIAGKLHVTVPE